MKNIRSRVEILSNEDIARIHEATLGVLRDVGCRLPHKRILDRLAEAGADVDFAKAVAKLPGELIEKAVKELSGREKKSRTAGDFCMAERSGPVRLGVSTQASIVDYGASSRRQGTTDDVLKGIVLCNELPNIGGCMPLVAPWDAPGFMHDLYGYYLCALYSRKPHGVYVLTPETARRIMKIARLKGENRKISYLLEPNGALSYDDFSLEMALTFLDAGHRFGLGPMAMAGMDAPITPAGTLVMQNAYNLAGNVLAYLWGCDGSWCGSIHALDMRSSLCSFGSPTRVLTGLAAVQLGEWYGFDVGVNAALTDACVPDFQGGFEKGLSAAFALLSGAGFGAQGIVGADQGVSLEQLVIDDEWLGALNHILRVGVVVDDDALGADAIRRVGILGSFLSDEHTLRHMRDNYWRSNIFNHESWDAWMSRGGKDANARAREVVAEILSRHYPPKPVVGEDVKREIDATIEDAMAHPELFQTARYRYEPQA
ncbi:MAG TPA: trimethylamine methyltransferase family protein [Candidatus Brocadiia bacterium]|nr:trimethylamine methyltransferase family protein [Candidatus Brocadiia bacterium]